MEPFAGEPIVTIGAARMVKVDVTVALPASFDAVIANECAPGDTAFGPCGLAQGLMTGSESQRQVTSVAGPPPRVQLAVTGDEGGPLMTGLTIVGGETTVKLDV